MHPSEQRDNAGGGGPVPRAADLVQRPLPELRGSHCRRGTAAPKSFILGVRFYHLDQKRSGVITYTRNPKSETIKR